MQKRIRRIRRENQANDAFTEAHASELKTVLSNMFPNRMEIPD